METHVVLFSDLNRKVFQEYVDTMDTVETLSKLHVPYVPHLFDLVGAYPDAPWEEAMIPILDVVVTSFLFVKYDGRFINKPIKEVW